MDKEQDSHMGRINAFPNKDDDEDNDAIVNFTPVGFSVNNSGYNVNYSGDTTFTWQYIVL